MVTWNLSRRIRTAAWTLLGLCLPALIQAAPLRTSTPAATSVHSKNRIVATSESGDISKFVASGRQAYLEVAVDGGLHKIYCEHNGDYKALFVFGERDNPELLQFSYSDSARTIATVILEFRTEKGQVSPGLRVAGNTFIRSLKSDAAGFQEWQARFSSFPDKATWSAAVTDASFGNPTGIKIVDGDQIVFRPTDFFCQCDVYASPCSSGSYSDIVICLFQNLCTAWKCIEAGSWTPDCDKALEAAKNCAQAFE
ncbi:MAG: hypothetical protein ABI837_12360 [Acidobacteriota bacterium]